MPIVIGPDGAAVEVQPAPLARMRESISLLARAIEDNNWVNMAAPAATIDVSYEQRSKTITKARQTADTSPLAKTAINLLQHYTLGQGISVKAQNRPIVARIVDELMNDPRNKKILTTHDAQKEFLAALWTDGDFFPVLFPDTAAGTLQLGNVDALFVEDAIADPDNAKVTKWYKVRRPNVTYNFQNGQPEMSLAGDFVYYRHWENEDSPPPGMAGRLQPGLMMQISVDKRGKFGRSQLAWAMAWLEAHRQFMENRATINAAAASVAWRKKRSGPASDVAAEAVKMQSSLVTQANRYDTNPTKAAGATIVENQASRLEWVDTNTGGAAADFDERKLRMMAGAAMGGIPNHYFGDEANSNLATATAMELPLLKMYEDYQQLVRSVMIQIIEFALAVAHEAGRIGERDDSSKYAERVTTPQGVMDQPDVEAAAGGADKATPTPSKQGGVTVKTVITREAGPQLPYAPPPAPGLRIVPRPDNLPVPEPEVTSASAPVSWYVDIDFPPIVQKQIDLVLNALKMLNDMLPAENIESHKMITELALAAFGVNDIDQTMERLYPADMVAVLVPQPPPQAQPGFPGGPPPQPGPVTESLADYRARRLQRIREMAGDGMAAVIGG